MSNWKKLFSEFYDKNEAGGSSRWLVAPNVVEMFIENLLQARGQDEKTKTKFIQYLKDNPELRFWQALRNFSGYSFIMGLKKDLEPEDTFYIEADEEK